MKHPIGVTQIWNNEALTKKIKDLESRVKKLERAHNKPKKKRLETKTKARS